MKQHGAASKFYLYGFSRQTGPNYGDKEIFVSNFSEKHKLLNSNSFSPRSVDIKENYFPELFEKEFSITENLASRAFRKIDSVFRLEEALINEKEKEAIINFIIMGLIKSYSLNGLLNESVESVLNLIFGDNAVIFDPRNYLISRLEKRNSEPYSKVEEYLKNSGMVVVSHKDPVFTGPFPFVIIPDNKSKNIKENFSFFGIIDSEAVIFPIRRNITAIFYKSKKEIKRILTEFDNDFSYLCRYAICFLNEVIYSHPDDKDIVIQTQRKVRFNLNMTARHAFEYIIKDFSIDYLEYSLKEFKHQENFQEIRNDFIERLTDYGRNEFISKYGN